MCCDGGCGCSESVNEQTVVVSKRTENGNIVSVVKEEKDLNEQETLYEFGKKFETLMEKNCPTDASKCLTTNHSLKRNLMFILQAYANGWLLNNIKVLGEVGRNVNSRKI